MQAVILGQRIHQCSLRLFQGYGDRFAAESLTQLSYPGLYGFHFVFQFATLALRRTGGLQTPGMLLIRPIHSHERRELGFLRPRNFHLRHTLFTYPPSIKHRRRGLALFREILSRKSRERARRLGRVSGSLGLAVRGESLDS